MDEESRKPGASQHDAEPAALRAAAEAALQSACPQSQNGFKVELAKRCNRQTLKSATQTA
jgi:xanthine dehydrogenase YagS FAD-binding subunit